LRISADAQTCQTLVGTDRFPGLYDSLLYYEDHADEFVGADALHLLWSRIGSLQGRSEAFALMSIGSRNGGALLSHYFLNVGAAARGVNTTAARALLVCMGEDCEGSEHGAVFDVARDGRSDRLATVGAAAPLDTVWARHGGGSGGAVLRALDVAASVPAPDQVVAQLAETLKATEPVVIVSMPSARARTRLAAMVAALSRLGYHTFLAGTQRLLILQGDMWHPAWALPLGGPAGGEMTFVGVKATGALYAPLLASYNASGMVFLLLLSCVFVYVCICRHTHTHTHTHTYTHTHTHTHTHTQVIGCRPYRMSSFHTPEGYWADDCPPNFNVYRSSRLRNFELNLTLK